MFELISSSSSEMKSSEKDGSFECIEISSSDVYLRFIESSELSEFKSFLYVLAAPKFGLRFVA